MDENRLETLVKQSVAGNRDALDALVQAIKDPIFKMAVRMLGYPCDAEDATQEILIKIITSLSGFNYQSRFTTWMYKVCIHHLLNIRKKRADKWNISFQLWESLIYEKPGDLGLQSFPDAEQSLLISEVRTGCLQGLLLCLDKQTRICFILGDLFEMSGKEGASLLEITPETFRKRLSRGRKKLKAFMVKNCGLFNRKNPCRCEEQVARDIQTGMIDPRSLEFVDLTKANDPSRIEGILHELDDMSKVIALFRTHPDYSAPQDFPKIIETLMKDDQFTLLN